MCDCDPRMEFDNHNKSGESQNREAGKPEKQSVKVPLIMDLSRTPLLGWKWKWKVWVDVDDICEGLVRSFSGHRCAPYRRPKRPGIFHCTRSAEDD